MTDQYPTVTVDILTPESPRPTTSAQGKEKGWMLQLGPVTNRERAERLIDNTLSIEADVPNRWRLAEWLSRVLHRGGLITPDRQPGVVYQWAVGFEGTPIDGEKSWRATRATAEENLEDLVDGPDGADPAALSILCRAVSHPWVDGQGSSEAGAGQ